MTQREYIAAQTQATSEWGDTPLSAAHASDAKVDGLALRIELRKMGEPAA